MTEQINLDFGTSVEEEPKEVRKKQENKITQEPEHEPDSKLTARQQNREGRYGPGWEVQSPEDN